MSGSLSRFDARDADYLRRANPRLFLGVNDPLLSFEFAVEILFRNSGQQATIGIPADAVKSVDRPAIEPQTEVLNQYNKKRVIYTGYKLRPLKIAFYDFRQSDVTRLLVSYTKHFFGDFNQPASSWQYDQTHGTFNDNGAGFGFTASHGQAAPNNDTGAGYFFDAIRIYQSLNSRFVQMTEIVNARISEFDFDNYDYGSNEPVVINIAFEFEGMLISVIDRDGAQAEGVRSDVANAVINYPAQDVIPSRAGDVVASAAAGGRVPGRDFNNPLGAAGWRANGGNAGSGLNLFGDFSFGNALGIVASRAVTGNFSGIGSELAFSATRNPILATILNNATTQNSRSTVADIGSAVLGSLQRPTNGVSAALWDAARAGVGASTLGSRATQGTVANTLTQGLFASAAGGGARGVNRTAAGLFINEQGMAMTNVTQPGYAQYGFNRARLGGQ